MLYRQIERFFMKFLDIMFFIAVFPFSTIGMMINNVKKKK